MLRHITQGMVKTPTAPWVVALQLLEDRTKKGGIKIDENLDDHTKKGEYDNDENLDEHTEKGEYDNDESLDDHTE
eukprot:3906930-Amphidinium_carterae.1